jgi:hypothetical protein
MRRQTPCQQLQLQLQKQRLLVAAMLVLARCLLQVHRPVRGVCRPLRLLQERPLAPSLLLLMPLQLGTLLLPSQPQQQQQQQLRMQLQDLLGPPSL